MTLTKSTSLLTKETKSALDHDRNHGHGSPVHLVHHEEIQPLMDILESTCHIRCTDNNTHISFRWTTEDALLRDQVSVLQALDLSDQGLDEDGNEVENGMNDEENGQNGEMIRDGADKSVEAEEVHIDSIVSSEEQALTSDSQMISTNLNFETIQSDFMGMGIDMDHLVNLENMPVASSMDTNIDEDFDSQEDSVLVNEDNDSELVKGDHEDEEEFEERLDYMTNLTFTQDLRESMDKDAFSEVYTYDTNSVLASGLPGQAENDQSASAYEYKNDHYQMTGSTGKVGFKGTKRGTSHAAETRAKSMAKQVRPRMPHFHVYIKGIGNGRATVRNALMNGGINFLSVTDVTRVPHNGCRPKKARRV